MSEIQDQVASGDTVDQAVALGGAYEVLRRRLGEQGQQLQAAAEVFDACIMCNLCTLACPENIRLNYLGLFARRMKAARTLRPIDLMRRLQQIDNGSMRVEIDAATKEAR